MSKQTSFQKEDAEALLNQIQQFKEILKQEWGRVMNQWGNLKPVWRDKQFDNFEPLFEKLSVTYDDAERQCEKYIASLHKEIKINEEREQRLANRINT